MWWTRNDMGEWLNLDHAMVIRALDVGSSHGIIMIDGSRHICRVFDPVPFEMMASMLDQRMQDASKEAKMQAEMEAAKRMKNAPASTAKEFFAAQNYPWRKQEAHVVVDRRETRF